MAEQTPQTPAAPSTPDPAPPAAPPAAPSADEKEWEQAVDDYSKDHGIVKGDPVSEPTKPKEGAETKGATDQDKKDQKPDAQPKPGDDPQAKTGEDKPDGEGKPDDQEEEQPQDDPSIRTSRQVQRQIAEDEAVMKADIRKEMFSDVQTELLDADGDKIETIEHVMKLQNPNTGKAFTQEEAAAWLLAAQQHIAKRLDEVDAQIDEIAAANLDIKDWADAVKTKYGAFIKANPEIWKPIWAEYQGTLVKDEKTNIITKAPVNLERFAEVALAPHIQLAEQMQKEKEQAEEAAKAKQNQDRSRTQSDRADVTATGKPDTRSKDEKEWEQAAKDLYES